MLFIWSIVVLAGLFVALAGALVVAERVLINYGICTIQINDGEEELQIEGGDSLLDVLYGNEIFIPSACGGRGSCAKCKVTVPAGGGPVLPTETPYLTRREIRSQVRLACQVKVREDMKVSMPEEYLHVQMFTSRVERTEDLTHDIRFIRLALEDPPEMSFRPGQYVQVQVPSPEGIVYRAYSISNPDYEQDAVELIVRLVPGGLGSTYLHEVQEGQQVTFTGPFGEFRLDEDPETEVVCVGGGCGMAPIRSIIYSLLNRWPDRKCWLFFGCRATKDIFYLDVFQGLEKKHPGFRVIYALSDMQPEEDWDGETGFIHLSVDKHLESDARRQAFLCGPPPMIEAVTSVLEQKGMAPSDWYYDEF